MTMPHLHAVGANAPLSASTTMSWTECRLIASQTLSSGMRSVTTFDISFQAQTSSYGCGHLGATPVVLALCDVEAAYRPVHLGIDYRFFRHALHYALCLRDRFAVLDFAGAIGVEPEVADLNSWRFAA